MAQAGIRLTLLLGRAVPAPAPLELVQALDSLEVIHGERAPSGLQMIFRTGRAAPRGVSISRSRRARYSARGRA